MKFSVNSIRVKMTSTKMVTVAEVLELRTDGLTKEEIWSLLCQAVQTLQDLFLSEKINCDLIFPWVSPHTLEISYNGKVILSFISKADIDDENFLAPEYEMAGKNKPSDLDWEKMWVYSLGKTLLSSFRADAIKDENLEMVLEFMTKQDPRSRASLMSLLNIISEHCKLHLPSKPFSHMLMDLYQAVIGTPPQCLLLAPAADRVEIAKERTPEMNPHFPTRNVLLNMVKKIKFHESSDDDLRPNETSTPVKRNPVQRAASRLYRGPVAHSNGIQSGCLLPETCIGPEFVVRGTEPPKIILIGDVKTSLRATMTVILLTGQKVHITCDPQNITCGKLFEILVRMEELEDNYMFGLARLINGDFVFIPFDVKLHKVAPPGWKYNYKKSTQLNFLLYFRVKIFLPTLRGVKNPVTKHLVYLQLRRSLLEQQIKCELEELKVFGGLALQAEFGNYDMRKHGGYSYFLIEHYLPEELIDDKKKLENELEELHKSRSGLDPDRAKEIFVSQVQRLPEYGSHHYTALWVRKSVNIPMWITVNLKGVYLYEKKKNVIDRKIHEAFIWRNIQGLSYSENYFSLVPRGIGGQKTINYKLQMDSKKSFFLFRLASFHHQFFLKLRVELSSLHALSQEFGILLKKESKNQKFPVESKTSRTQEWNQRTKSDWPRNYKKTPVTFPNIEELQNKENENPLEKMKEKRKGVKMGVGAFCSPHTKSRSLSDRRFSFSEASKGSSNAYVLDSSIKSSDEKFTYDLEESISINLANKFRMFPWEEERILKKVYLAKDKYGSFGLEVIQGSNGGLFIENVLKRKDSDDIDLVQKGDQLLSVNGVCLLSLNYSEALNVLKNSGNEIEVLLSQSQNCRKEFEEKTLECEYLKAIRYDTALEVNNFETKSAVFSPACRTLAQIL